MEAEGQTSGHTHTMLPVSCWAVSDPPLRPRKGRVGIGHLHEFDIDTRMQETSLVLSPAAQMPADAVLNC